MLLKLWPAVGPQTLTIALVQVQLLHTLHENGGMVPLGARLFVTGGHWKGMDGDYRVEMEVYDCAKDRWVREGCPASGSSTAPLPSSWTPPSGLRLSQGTSGGSRADSSGPDAGRLSPSQAGICLGSLSYLTSHCHPISLTLPQAPTPHFFFYLKRKKRKNAFLPFKSQKFLGGIFKPLALPTAPFPPAFGIQSTRGSRANLPSAEAAQSQLPLVNFPYSPSQQ